MATYTTNIGLAKPAPTDPADIGVLNSNFDKIDALGGYGLGRTRAKLIANDALLSDQVTGGMYYWTDSNTDPDKPFAAGEMLVIPRGGAGYLNQIAFGKDRTVPEIKVRQHTGDTIGWSEWEYVNPPMQSGVEYRTTERWNGSPVYTKLVSCGELPSDGEKHVVFANENSAGAFEVYGKMINPDGTWCSIPYSDQVVVYTYARSIIIRATGNRTGWYGYVAVKYTK